MTRVLRGLAYAAAALAIAALAACGSSPSSPSGALDLSGSWSGTWQYVTAGTNVTDMVTASITQNSATAIANWTAAGGAGGRLTFTPAASVAGTFTITQVTLTGQSCSASASFSGTASSSTIDVIVDALPSSGLCQWASGNHFTLHR